MMKSEEKRIRENQNGNKKLFAGIVKKYTGMVFKLIWDLTSNIEDTKDLTQETFSRAFININSFQFKSGFSTWLYEIAYNCTMDFLRKNARISTGLEENNFQSTGNSPDYDSERKTKSLNAALSTLPEKQKIAVVLHFYHQISLKEVGEILGCSHSTARVHLFRGLKKLRQELSNKDTQR